MTTSATLRARSLLSPQTSERTALRGLPSCRYDERVGRIVMAGLTRRPKELEPVLFYDALGSALFERITELPEYYLTRTEREILHHHADAIVEQAAGLHELMVAELGAGSCTKSELLLDALIRRQRRGSFVPIDVSASPLTAARARLMRSLPSLAVRPHVGDHASGLSALAAYPERKLVLFIGSSIGNYDHAAARALLRSVRASLGPGDALLLGTDLRKDPAALVAAYDDSQGVTAAFNKNALSRINAELWADFDLDRFEHRALWNAAESRMEMHLESTVAQVVRIRALGMDVAFGAGERIHTESSYKYDDAMVAALLGSSGFRSERTFTDAESRFAVHLARAV